MYIYVCVCVCVCIQIICISMYIYRETHTDTYIYLFIIRIGLQDYGAKRSHDLFASWRTNKCESVIQSSSNFTPGIHSRHCWAVTAHILLSQCDWVARERVVPGVKYLLCGNVESVTHSLVEQHVKGINTIHKIICFSPGEISRTGGSGPEM